MKIITRSVIDWETLAIEEEDSYEYEGPLSEAKSSGSAPAAVDPYQAAGAQYGLSTGTANYNAGLNRVNTQNPLGGSYWSVNGYGPYQGGSSVSPSQGVSDPSTSNNYGAIPLGGGAYAPTSGSQVQGSTSSNNAPAFNAGHISSGSTAPTSSFNPGHVTNSNVGSAGNNGTLPMSQNPVYGGTPLGSTGTTSTDPYATQLAQMEQQQAPNYTQTTQLLPWAQNMLQSPINTSGIAGMPGGPSTTQDLQNTQNALYNQQMAYIAPEQQLQSEQLQSQLANEGITPGSAAYNNEMDRLSRSQTFANNQAINSAITGGGAEQSRLFGLGSQSLQNQLAVRNAPINEYNELQPSAGGSASAQTPDISGAFTNQLQSQLAGYNANVASDNATTSDVTGLIASYLLYASDVRLKENIRKVGKTDGGLNVYIYNYKGHPGTHMGVMAQEAEQVYPDAVKEYNGYKYVNYGAIA